MGLDSSCKLFGVPGPGYGLLGGVVGLSLTVIVLVSGNRKAVATWIGFAASAVAVLILTVTFLVLPDHLSWIMPCHFGL